MGKHDDEIAYHESLAYALKLYDHFQEHPDDAWRSWHDPNWKPPFEK